MKKQQPSRTNGSKKDSARARRESGSSVATRPGENPVQANPESSSIALPLDGVDPLTTRRLMVRALPFAVLLVAVAIAVWWPTLSFRFIYDDHSQIENNSRIHSAEHLGQLLTEPLWAQLGPGRASPYYRPFFSLMYLSQYLLFGPNPAAWHAVSLGLHISAVLSAFLLLLLLFEEVVPAFLGSLVFAVLPANAEVVSFLGAADDSAFSMLLILSLCALIGSRASANAARFENGGRAAKRRLWLLLLSGILFLLALFTKETAVGAGLVLISYAMIAARRRDAQMVISASLVYLIPVALYCMARGFAMQGSTPSLQRRGILSVLSVAPSLTLLSLRELTWPVTISAFHDVSSTPGAGTIAGAAVVLLALAASFMVSVKAAPVIAWAITLFILPVVPWAMALFYLSEYALFQNRYLYLSSLAISVLVACGLSRLAIWPRTRAATAAALLTICAALAAKAQKASLPYHDDIALFRHAVEAAPANVLAVGLLADAEEHAGHLDAARDLYEKAVRLQPNLWNTQFNLAMIYLKQGAGTSATERLMKSVALADSTERQRALSWYEVGLIKAGADDVRGAESAFREAERQEPSSRRVHAQLARLLELEGRHEEAAVEKLRSEEVHGDEGVTTGGGNGMR